MLLIMKKKKIEPEVVDTLAFNAEPICLKSFFEKEFKVQKTPPVKKPPTKYMSVTEIAEHFEIDNKDALRMRLFRFREQNKLNANAFREVQNRGVRQPRFLYNVEMVRPIIGTFANRSSGEKLKNFSLSHAVKRK